VEDAIAAVGVDGVGEHVFWRGRVLGGEGGDLGLEIGEGVCAGKVEEVIDIVFGEGGWRGGHFEWVVVGCWC
jgi:hypothetical protein